MIKRHSDIANPRQGDKTHNDKSQKSLPLVVLTIEQKNRNDVIKFGFRSEFGYLGKFSDLLAHVALR